MVFSCRFNEILNQNLKILIFKINKNFHPWPMERKVIFEDLPGQMNTYQIWSECIKNIWEQNEAREAKLFKYIYFTE